MCCIRQGCVRRIQRRRLSGPFSRALYALCGDSVTRLNEMMMLRVHGWVCGRKAVPFELRVHRDGVECFQLIGGSSTTHSTLTKKKYGHVI